MRNQLATPIRSLAAAAALWVAGVLVVCAPSSDVWSAGDAIHYRGELSERLNRRVYALYEEAAVDPTRLIEGLERFGVQGVEVESPPYEPKKPGRDDDFFLIPDESLSD